MQWLFAILMGVGFVEIVLRLPLFRTLAQFRRTVDKVMAVFRSKSISDHWKEKVLPKYAVLIFKLTVLIAFYLLLAFVPFFVLGAVATALQVPFLEFSMSMTGILFVTVIAAAYAKGRSAYVTARL